MTPWEKLRMLDETAPVVASRIRRMKPKAKEPRTIVPGTYDLIGLFGTVPGFSIRDRCVSHRRHSLMSRHPAGRKGSSGPISDAKLSPTRLAAQQKQLAFSGVTLSFLSAAVHVAESRPGRRPSRSGAVFRLACVGQESMAMCVYSTGGQPGRPVARKPDYQKPTATALLATSLVCGECSCRCSCGSAFYDC